MRPERIDFEHRLNGRVIKSHLGYVYNRNTDVLSVVYVVDDPVYSQRATVVYRTFEEEVLGQLTSDMDAHNVPHPRKTKVIIMPGFLPVPLKS